MQRERTVSELFGDADVLVFVDDWKGGQSGRPLSPIYFLGRVLERGDASNVERLQELLVRGDADRWHASGRRGECQFLFSAPEGPEIVAQLSSMKTCAYDMLMSVEDLTRPHIEEQWRGVIEEYANLRAVFDVATPYARGFFRYSDFLLGTITRMLPPGTIVRTVVDTLDWLTNRTDALHIADPGLVQLGVTDGDVRGELVMMTNKEASGVKKYLRFLGLVDSEAWAFGKLQTTKLADGRTVRDRFLDWQANGQPDDPVLTPDDLPAFERHPQPLKDYWTTCNDWRKRGRLRVLNDALAPRKRRRARDAGVVPADEETK